MKVDFNIDVRDLGGEVIGKLDSKQIANLLYTNSSSQNPVGFKILTEKIYKSKGAIEVNEEESAMLAASIVQSQLRTPFANAILEQLK